MGFYNDREAGPENRACLSSSSLELYYVGSLGALGSIANVKTHSLNLTVPFAMNIYLLFLYLNVTEASHNKNRKEKVFAVADNKDIRNFI